VEGMEVVEGMEGNERVKGVMTESEMCDNSFT